MSTNDRTEWVADPDDFLAVYREVALNAPMQLVGVEYVMREVPAQMPALPERSVS